MLRSSIENLEKMPMPVTVLVKETNGKEHKMNLPVEIWQRGAEWTFDVPSTSEIKEVILTPIKNYRNGTGIIIPGRRKRFKLITSLRKGLLVFLN